MAVAGPRVLMAKMFKYDGAAVASTLQRIREGVDYGNLDMRPGYDGRERAEAVNRVATDRPIDKFHAVLEHHGFRYYPPAVVLDAAVRSGMGGGPELEGEWRNRRVWMNGARGAAFRPSDILANFLTPEDFDKWMKQMLLRAKLQRRRVPKAESRIAIARG